MAKDKDKDKPSKDNLNDDLKKSNMNIKKVAKNKALEAALESMKKHFGKGFIRKGSDLEIPDTFPTGHDDLDAVLVKDGFGMARGRIVELSGPESCGKSSLALRVCGYAQKQGYTPLWIDLERALVKGGIAEVNGVDMDNIFIPELADTTACEEDDEKDSSTPYDAGKILDMMIEAIRTEQFNPIVLDSVAGLIPEREMNAETLNKEQMMEVPRLLSKALRRISQLADDHNICVIFVNQERDKPNPGGQPATTTPGGRALKFFASQRLRVTRVGGKEGEIYKFDEDGKQSQIGHWAKVRILKNRCAPPYTDPIEVPIYYQQHFPDEAERLYDAARNLQVITTRSGDITWKSGDEIIFKVDGSSKALAQIRERDLTKRLAYECIQAEKSEKNQKKKVPFKLAATLAALGADYNVDTPTV